MINEGKHINKKMENDTLMAKTPQNEDTDTTYSKRTLQVAIQAVIIKQMHCNTSHTRNETRQRYIKYQCSTCLSQYFYCNEKD